VQLLPGPGPVQGFPAGGGAGPPCLALSERRLSGSLRYPGQLSKVTIFMDVKYRRLYIFFSVNLQMNKKTEPIPFKEKCNFVAFM
jgi:hypothetical protein